MELGLSGKKVLVTGSTRGIGKATVEAFLREKAIVWMNGRTISGEDIAQLKEYDSERVKIAEGDFTNIEDVKKIAKNFVNETDGLDILIANVGAGKPEAGLLEAEEWKRFYDINVISAVNAVREFLPLLEATGNACIVLVSSIAGREKIPAPYGYAAAKSAVLTLNRYLAKDLAPKGIRVNCVMPGNVFFQGGRWEELIRNDQAGIEHYIEEAVPLKRFATPEEIADVIVFLSSERAKYLTGTVLPIDGGQLNSII